MQLIEQQGSLWEELLELEQAIGYPLALFPGESLSEKDKVYGSTERTCDEVAEQTKAPRPTKRKCDEVTEGTTND